MLTSRIATRHMSVLSSLDKGLIDGKWVEAQSKKRFEINNPANGKVVGNAPDMDIQDTQLAIQAAGKAFQKWSQTTAKERAKYLRRWYDLLVKHGDEIAKIMTMESGKPINESKGEVIYGNSFVEFFSEEARRVHGEVIEGGFKNRQLMLLKQPLGVVGLITPWNFPHAMITRKAAAAISVGCTCVIRPAEDTPLTAIALLKLAEEAEIPNGVLNLVTSSRNNVAQIGKLLCESPDVAGISFTGSTEVGKLLYKQCSSGIKRIGLELGGNAPFIVFPSANIDLAIQGAVASKLRNCGQTCISSNRFFIHESIYDEFVGKYIAALQKVIKIGDPADASTTVGPLINQMQLGKVKSFVNDAVEKGAKVLLGGKPSKVGDLYYEPTVLSDIKPNMAVHSQEIFGPVAPIFKFSSEEEVMKMANNTRRGLAGYFYSQDHSQIYRVSQSMEVGMVGVNEGLISTCEAAFGGVKESGIGREGSHYGLDEYLNIKYVCVGNLDLKPSP